MQPETKFAWLGGDRIAYQVLGEGPPDLVLARRSYGHIDVAWEDPGITLFLRTLASFCRLILFDRRGTGPSDPLRSTPYPPGSPMPRSWLRCWTRSAPGERRSWPSWTPGRRRC